MGRFMYEVPPRMSSQRTRCPDEVSYAKRVLDITERLGNTPEPPSSEPSIVFSPALIIRSTSFLGGQIEGISSLRCTESGGEDR